MSRSGPVPAAPDALSSEELLDLLLEEEGYGGAELPSVAPRGDREPGPLSFGQQRLWFLERLASSAPVHTLGAAIRLRGPLDLAALDRALRELARRHEVLRSRFPERNGSPVRVVDETVEGLGVTDLAALPRDVRGGALDLLLGLERRRPFDLAAGPLCRFHLMRLDATDHVLLTLAHHVVTDGWSMGVLTRELTALYRAFAAGERTPFEEPRLQYADFAAGGRVYVGRLSLFRTEGASLLDEARDRGAYTKPVYGWDRLVSGKIDIYRVPGDHNTLLQPPHVEVLTERLRIPLEQARREPVGHHAARRPVLNGIGASDVG